MQPTGKPKKKKNNTEIDNRKIDDFNTFALSCFDAQTPRQAFFILNGTQIVQNYACHLSYEEVVTRWRSQK